MISLSLFLDVKFNKQASKWEVDRIVFVKRSYDHKENIKLGNIFYHHALSQLFIKKFSCLHWILIYRIYELINDDFYFFFWDMMPNKWWISSHKNFEPWSNFSLVFSLYNNLNAYLQVDLYWEDLDAIFYNLIIFPMQEFRYPFSNPTPF